MAVLWNPGCYTITLKRNTAISYVKESDYVENPKLTNDSM